MEVHNICFLPLKFVKKNRFELDLIFDIKWFFRLLEVTDKFITLLKMFWVKK